MKLHKKVWKRKNKKADCKKKIGFKLGIENP